MIWGQGESHIWVRSNEKLLCYCIELFRWYILSLNHPDLNSVYADFWFSGYKYSENMLYTRETAVSIDTSKKGLKMLSIIIINIFIDCYTRFYYFLILRHIICPSPSI